MNFYYRRKAVLLRNNEHISKSMSR